MGSRRKPDAAWSVSFSVSVRAGTGKWVASSPLVAAPENELRHQLRGMDGVRYRWRYAGDQRSATFSLPGDLEEAVAFRQHLVAAIAGDWPADERGHPLRPAHTPRPVAATGTVVEPTPAPTPAVLRLPTPAGRAAPAGTGAGLATVTALSFGRSPSPGPTGGLNLPSATDDWDDLVEETPRASSFAELVTWRLADLQRHLSKRRTTRAGSTLANVETELGFAAEFFRYRPGDHRLGQGVHPWDSMRFDHPAALTEDDCRALVEHRKRTNLRTRGSNLRAERRWAKDIEAAERASSRSGEPIELPVAPALEPEQASARTVVATTTTVRAALADAHAEGVIEANPWTARVDKLIAGVAPVHFTEKHLPNADQVVAIADAVAAHRRDGYVGGVRQVLDGGRYRVMVLTAYGAILRVEEVVALRISNLVLDGPNPGIVVTGGEVRYPLRFCAGGAGLVLVPLKHRLQGDTRWVPIDRRLADELRAHLERYVAAPDPSSSDPDAQDPRVFTSHNRGPLDRGSFTTKWWKPALAELFTAPGDAHLAELAFRHMRHAGITARLLDGHHYEDVATWAGNSPLVITRHYRGVIDRMRSSVQVRSPQGAALADSLAGLAAEVASLNPDEAAARVARELPQLDTVPAIALGRALVATGKARLDEEDR